MFLPVAYSFVNLAALGPLQSIPLQIEGLVSGRDKGVVPNETALRFKTRVEGREHILQKRRPGTKPKLGPILSDKRLCDGWINSVRASNK